MKIQYASDLHLEFSANSNFLKSHPLIPTGDILVLAGDIGYLNDDNYSKHPFWDLISENYQQVIVVVGNHELYKYYDLAKIPHGLVCTIRDNVKCYYNEVVRIENADFIVSTLWAKIPLEEAYLTEQGVSDFRRIMYNNATLSWDNFNREHDRCLHYIQKEVAESTAEHIIVVTHHVPSFQLISPDFAGSKINGDFSVELGQYIENSPIEYWIYGHSHRNIDKEIGQTKCISNQLGYVFYNEHLTFDPQKTIEMM
jgi:hypothetical protein